MTGGSILLGFAVFIAVIALFTYFNNKADQVAQTSKVLDAITADTSKFNFVLTEIPIELSDQEKALAVLPKTALLEPKAVRVGQRRYLGSSLRIAKGVSLRSGRQVSTSESLDRLRRIDQGKLVVTNKRIAFLGTMRTVFVEIEKIVSVDTYIDGIGLHCSGKDKVECFLISPDLTIKYSDNDEKVTVPFAGQILHHIVSEAMAHRSDRKYAA
jgi:hypothetical protein